MIKKIATILLSIEFITMVLLFCCCFATIPFGIQPYGIESGSMTPAIHKGDMVYVDKDISASDIIAGDVVAFNITNDTICTHRIVSNDVENHSIVTKGDANPVEDPSPVDYSSIIGKVVFVLPMLGSAFMFFNTFRIPIIIVVVCITLLLLIFSCTNFNKNNTTK